MSDDQFLVIIVLVLFVCGIFAGGVAHDRGGNFFAGFLVGLFFGPFGVVIAFFLGSKEGRNRLALSHGDMKQCPDCAELVKVEARKCRFCGHSFVAEPAGA